MDDNVIQAIPFFAVSDMEASLRFYLDGIGFTLTNKWIDDGKLRWCWLQLGGAAVMLQEFGAPEGKVGIGVTINFLCRDAIELYHQFKARGLEPSKPFVGNAMWVTSVEDPDSFRLFFESPTDAAEETEYSE